MAIVKIPFRSRVMGFSNNRPLFLFLWERRFAIGNSGTQLATVGDQLEYTAPTIFRFGGVLLINYVTSVIKLNGLASYSQLGS